MNDLETFLDQRYQIVESAETPGLAVYKPTGVLVTIKKADYLSPYFAKQVRNLKTEILVLKALADTNVPQIIDLGEKSIQVNPEEQVEVPYVALEYISGDRVSKIIDSLSLIERLNILIQLLGCLDIAHSRQIANGNLDLLHLYWFHGATQLIITDWGNAIINVTDAQFFAFDLAKAAEIADSLIAHNQEELPQDIPSIIQRFIKWGRKHHRGLPDASSIDPLLTASRLREAAQIWKYKLLLESNNDILGFKLVLQNSPDITNFSLMFNQTVEAIDHIYSVYSILLTGAPATQEKLLIQLRTESKTKISSLLNANERPQIIKFQYGSPVSVDLLGIGKVCEIVRDLAIDISWRAKHQKQLAELERAGKQVEIRQAKLNADKIASELAAQRLELEKTSLDIALQKIELIQKINQMQLSQNDKITIANSLVPATVFLSTNTAWSYPV